VTSVVWTADGKAVLSAAQDRTVRLTPVNADNTGGKTGDKTGGVPARVLKLEAAASGIAVLPDGRVLLACADGALREADAKLTAVRTVVQVDGPLTVIAVSPDGKTAVTGGLRTPATLIDLTTGKILPAKLGNGLPAWTLTFAASGAEIFTGGIDRVVRRFDAASGAAISPAIPTAASPDIAEAKDRGARVFRACVACHGLTSRDTNLAGPTLAGIMGRRIASQPGYEYSAPFAKLDITWTPETIARLFEVGPAKFTPGTKMPEQRITDPDDRRALVEWLARVTVP
jgi:cytochrome c